MSKITINLDTIFRWIQRDNVIMSINIKICICHLCTAMLIKQAKVLNVSYKPVTCWRHDFGIGTSQSIDKNGVGYNRVVKH